MNTHARMHNAIDDPSILPGKAKQQWDSFFKRCLCVVCVCLLSGQGQHTDDCPSYLSMRSHYSWPGKNTRLACLRL